MGPSGRTRTRTARKGSRRKSSSSSSSQLIKKNTVVRRPKNQESTPRVNSPSNSLSSSDDFPKTEGIEFEAVDDVVVSTSGCSTPKGQRFRIPEVMTCPPAPKKQRVISNCSLQRSPIAFFAPPDLELFFYFALRGISV
ncbi:hypothetical protein TorRG33x02_150290 [Trema orientale]|uniref:Cyclin-dependent kinase inhibitor n=1 Tax=Trema orientale TaxID=63057 RepID=A0A2P5EUG7_TREOI|nr:hypothetical protein TorRG33x02_150290 [Trema orientale]